MMSDQVQSAAGARPTRDRGRRAETDRRRAERLWARRGSARDLLLVIVTRRGIEKPAEELASLSPFVPRRGWAKRR